MFLTHVNINVYFRNEYYPADDNNAPTQDIRKKDKTDSLPGESNDDMIDDKDGDDAPGLLEEPEKVDRKKRVGAVNKCLVAMLELFSKFHSPKSMHQESKLKELYFKVSLFFILFKYKV